jgi:PKHD-type hydroxylase
VPLFSKITEIIVNANLNFFNYDIYDLEALQFTTYPEGYNGFYSKHVDTHAVSSATNVRKLSFSLQLSSPDSYEGGDLLLWAEKEPIVAPKNRGDLIIFPSYVMHEVTPVTGGLRSSLVGWVTGPAWK